MLARLSIRDIVLIERLDIEFSRGLAVLTGETGAGKSILLDAFALALGGRGDAGLVRHGVEQGQVTAVFDVPKGHPAAKILSDNGLDDTGEMILRRVIREEAGITATAPAEKWRNGQLVLRPGNTALQEKSWPIETFFHKIVMLRNRLRTLEQQINAMDIAEDAKVKLQGYVTGCYGSLTSFNVLFAEEQDQFRGAGE
jgi:energy-coupling factor transporter ATP-binding protein EcfA2